MVILLNPERPKSYVERDDLNGGADRKTIELSFSGMVENGMWPAKKRDWERAGGENGVLVPDPTWSIAMHFFKDLSEWLEKEKRGSTDTFMLHNVVRTVMI